MPDAVNEIERYRGSLVASKKPHRNLISDSSSNSNNGGEDWVTRKRVQTKTTKNIERRVQRQVVLEDGRVIEEDDPEITVDTIEDTQSHSDDGKEDRHIVGAWGRSANRALQNENGQVSAWHPGGNILGEKMQRNIYTTDVKQQSYSTTSASNLGDISSNDVKKIIREGRSSRTFIKPIPDAEKAVIPTRLTHKNANRHRVVDTEDVEEVQRIQDGRVKTDRFVSRECVEDDNAETPSDGSSTESESHDGDRDSFSNRKEDRYIDYYSVPKGKSIKEGKFLRHGIHLTSYDKGNKAGGLDVDSVRRPALPYKGDSDSTGDLWSSKPPKPVNPPSRSRRINRFSSSERETTKSPAPREDFPVHYSKPIPSTHKFHTIERSNRASNKKEFYHSSNHGYGAGMDKRPVSQTRGRPVRSIDSDSSYSRSRSASRGPQQIPKRSNLKQTDHHRSMGTLRGDLDAERTGRLKRAMSFTSHDRGRRSSTGSDSKSLIGSFKSLYASLTKSGKKDKENRVNAANRAWFDHDGQGAPKRPPRKTRSTASSMASGYSGYNKRHNKSSTHLNQDFDRPRASTGGSSFDVRDAGGASRSWEMYSSNSNLKSSRHHSPAPRKTPPQRASPPRRSSPPRRPSRPVSAAPASPTTIASSAASMARERATRVERRKTMSGIENREPRRFEEERQVRQRGQVRSRFFGQQDEGDSDQDGRRESRPPPDMRRLLLNNVNLTRSKSMSKDLEQRPSVIRAI